MDKNELNKKLLYACYSGNLKTVDYLLTSPYLKEHANIYNKDNEGWNSLIYACFNGNLQIVEYLILEKNMIIDEDTMKFLIKDKYFDIIKMIKSRDLKNKLNSKLVVKEVIKRSKI